jgi:hypothetical protein
VAVAGANGKSWKRRWGGEVVEDLGVGTLA